jgi:hypothetical protein
MKILSEAAYRRRTERANARFEKATNAQKRVIIAKDVIAQMKMGKYNVEQGTYADFYTDTETVTPALFMSPPDSACCTVCGIGSLLVSSAILRKTHLSSCNRSPIGHTYLAQLFGNKQLWSIEVAFEEWDPDDPHYCDPNYEMTIAEQRRAAKFGSRYKSDETRLIGIMENIIRYRGRFRPDCPPLKRRRARAKVAKPVVVPVKQPIKVPVKKAVEHHVAVRIDGQLQPA